MPGPYSPAMLDAVARHGRKLYGHLAEERELGWRYWREIYAPDFVRALGGEAEFIAFCEAVRATRDAA
jgi:hypothetical protein